MSETWYTGTVLKGNQIGSTIGVPTINLDPIALQSDSPLGVYAAYVKIENQRKYPAVLYLGPRDAIQQTDVVLEIHLLEFNENIYGQTVEYQPVHFIRPVIPIHNLQELSNQMKKDIQTIKIYFQNNKNHDSHH